MNSVASGDTTPLEPAADTWAIRVARVRGIPIRIHFTFLLFVTWIALSGVKTSGPKLLVSLLALFFCIVLHELGHSLVAQKYGYRVRDITLYPIGGVAAIEGSPRPRHELYIALAGPAVNVVIAAVLATILGISHHLPEWSWPPWASSQNIVLLQSSPLAFLLVANLSVVAFNMLPAFPMDGGRVLRAVLGLLIGKPRATFIAATVGQLMAILMGLYGAGILNGQRNYGLCIIALFVYFGAGQERRIEETDEALAEVALGDVMEREFRTLQVGETLQHAADVLLATQQQDFPVLAGPTEIAGVLSRKQMLRGLAEHGPTAFVAAVMTRDPLFATSDDLAEDYLLRADGVQHAPVLIRAPDGRLIGMVTAENLTEFLALRHVTEE